MNRHVLITGASGFIGSHLVEAARDAGYTVYAAVRASSDIAHLQQPDITFLQLDYSDVAAMTAILMREKIGFVIHAAGVTRAADPDAYNRVNATYTFNLATAARDAGVAKFVFLSSLAACGPAASASAGPLTESHPPLPVTGYGRSKLLAEHLLTQVGIPAVVLRPTAVYGPREKDLLIMIRTLRRGLEPYIGRQAQVLSFVHAEDLARIAVSSLELPATGIFHISDGRAYDRYRFAAIANEAMKRRPRQLHLPLPLVRVIAGILERVSGRKTPVLNREKLAELTAPGWQCSIGKAQRELQYNPRYTLETGLSETIGWYRRNKWL